MLAILSRGLEWLLVALIAVFSALLFLQVIARYVVDLGLFGLYDATALMAVWMYFLGAGYAAKSGEHISASLVEAVFPASARAPLLAGVIAFSISAVVMLIFAWWSAEYALWAYARGTVSDDLKIPRVHFVLPIALGCILMAWFFLVAAWRAGRDLATTISRDV
jgi:TRAP-type transport system small permease protein